MKISHKIDDELRQEVNKMMKYLGEKTHRFWCENKFKPTQPIKSWHDLLYSPSKNTVTYQGWEESHHNGDSYDEVFEEMPLTNEMLKWCKIRLLSDCKLKALQEMEQIKEIEEDQRINSYLKKKGAI